MLPSGALLIDTPGVRELGMSGEEEGLGEAFSEIDALAAGCAFGDCQHQTEPRCAVRAALETGELSAERFASYVKLKAEIAAAARKSQRPPRRR